MKFLFIVLLLLLFGCATRTVETDKLVKAEGNLSSKTLLKVPFVKQDDYHCGPATGAMLLEYAGISYSLKELSKNMYTKNAKGTFQTELVASLKEQGLLVIPIRSVENILKEVSAGNPVIVFQNLGFTFAPNWHYAVVTGHDLSGPDIYLHSRDDKNLKMDMRLFERSWILGGKWAMVGLPPGKLAATSSELTHVDAASSLETKGKLTEAKEAYSAILTRWPNSLGAHLGLGNVYYQEKNYSLSLKHLRLATLYHPLSPLAWHNRAFAEFSLRNKELAKDCSEKALELSDGELKEQLEISLQEIN